MQEHDHDVIVLGSGLAGSILATVLASQGVSVAMIERGSHPRLAIGESLIPTSAMWFWILGQKYDLPELSTLAHLDSISRNIGPSCGIKRGFGYVYHREGQAEVNHEESSMFIGAKQPVFRESQLYRQDIDHFLVRTAIDYGVSYRDRTVVTDVHIDADRATVELEDGTMLDTRYVIDATGRNSILAQKFGLRDSPCRLRHASRSIFSHLRNVKPFEEIAPEATAKRRSASWSHGTLHHVFDGGWFWIIPFNNYKASTNDLVSVGVTVRTDQHPKPEGVEPQKEFWDIVNRFPMVEKHLGPAEPAFDFIGTDRIQYSSSTSVGDRFLLLQHAYGFIDPLFSRGILRSLESVDAVAAELLAALADDDLSGDRFADIDRMQAAMLDDNDQMVFNAYRSMSDYDTWTSWLRVWFADEMLTTLPVLSATFTYAASGDLKAFDRIDGSPRPGTSYSFSAELEALVNDAEGVLDQVEAGTIGPATARRRILGMLAAADYLPDPVFDWAGEGEVGIDLTPPRLARLLWWGRRHAPAGLQAEAFDFRIRDLLQLQVRDALLPRSVRRDRSGNVIPQRRTGGGA